MMKKTYSIEIKELTKHYRDTVAVDALSLNVEEGELLSLLGINGAGKTTTVKMLSCLTQATSGDAILHGKSIKTESAEVRPLISVSPQETAVAQGLSVKENLELICGAHGFSKEKRSAKIKELSDRLDLGGVMNKRAGKLSGGLSFALSLSLYSIPDSVVFEIIKRASGSSARAR